jgi:PKD repeat protein
MTPVADFTISPLEPSPTEAIQLRDCSSDPCEVGIAWRAWDFGDGATSVGPAPVHRYAAEGTYEVKLTLATFDGRVTTRTVTLRVLPRAA